MKHKVLAIMFLGLALFHGRSAFGQFLPQEIAGRDGIERFLLTAEILRTEPIGEGVTKPTKVYLGKDGVEGKAVWKNPSGMQFGVLGRLAVRDRRLPDGQAHRTQHDPAHRGKSAQREKRLAPILGGEQVQPA